MELTIENIQKEIDGMLQYSCRETANHWQSQLNMFAEDAFMIDHVTGCIELRFRA